MSGRLPTWLLEWLHLESPGTGEGTSWRLDTAWNWAPWATLLLIISLAAWVIYWYAKESADTTRRAKTVLVALRIAALGLLLVMISELILTLERTGLPTVVVLVDRSRSMGIVDQGPSAIGISGDPAGGRIVTPLRSTREGEDSDSSAQSAAAEPTRLEAGKGFLLEDGARRLRQLDHRYKLALYAVATSAIPLGSDLNDSIDLLGKLSTDAPGSDSTRLGGAVRQVLAELKGSPPAAIVLLSDGITTDGQTLADAAQFAARKGVPLFTIGVGDDARIRDVELADLLADDVVFAGDLVSFDATVVGNGLEGDTATLEIREKGTETMLVEKTLLLGPDRVPQKIRLSIRPPQPGTFEYTVTVRPMDSEIETSNNSKSRLVIVREEKVRVLMAASAPSYEYRFLKNMLERDGTVELRVILQDADPDYSVVDQSALPVFPVREEELFEFDVLILCDVDLRRLTSRILENIKTFVIEKGGGLIWIAGERYSAQQFRDMPVLSSLLPFAPSTLEPSRRLPLSGFAARLTDFGWSTPMMQLADTHLETRKVWQNLPPLYWMLDIGEPNRAARVLAQHPTHTGFGGQRMPLILVQFVGAGKVLFHATDETWRWRYRVGDVFFARYWVQSVRYLARSKLLGSDRGVELSVNRQTYRHGDTVRIRARFFDESAAPPEDDLVQVVVEHRGQTKRRISLRRVATNRGVFEGTFSGATTGRYHLLLVQPTVEGRAPAADFRVVAPPGEFERLEMDSTELAAAAERSAGKFYPLRDASDFVSDLPEGRQVPIHRLPSQVLWNRWWMISIFIGLLVSEWVFRKRFGMI